MTITMNDFIEREIIYCASTLFGVLLKAAAEAPKGELDDGTTYDELLDLADRRDFEEAVLWHINREMSRSDLIDALDAAGVDDPRVDMRMAPEDRGEPWAGVPDDELREALKKYLWDEDEVEDFAREHDLDPYTVEVYEHWIVTNWLAAKLEEKGEAVARNICGLTIWGRCTTGQAISMDGVIKSIYKDLTGQEAEQ